jgi:hypothetical protein
MPRDRGTEGGPPAVKIGVISDWDRAARGNAWPRLLKELDPVPEVTIYPVADLMVSPDIEGRGLQSINKERVLIINWDAANGDPEFGAHLCQRWLEHRRPEIIEWVRKGGILLLESQTTLGVPCAPAYDAAVGKGELPTSGLDDPTKPLQSVAPRSGTTARKTALFPSERGFGSVQDRIIARDAYPDIKPFPSSTTGLLIDAVGAMDSGPLLWRGVFRKTLPYTRQLPWISIIQTDDKPLYRQSIMQVAKLGSGAIFACTMMLAATGQHELVNAIIRCADGNNDHLPTPVAAVERVNSTVKWVLTIFGGAVAGLIVGHTGPILARLKTGLSAIGLGSDPNTVEGWVKFLLIPIGVGIVFLGYRLYLRVRKFVRSVMGY